MARVAQDGELVGNVVTDQPVSFLLPVYGTYWHGDQDRHLTIQRTGECEGGCSKTGRRLAAVENEAGDRAG